MALSVSSRQSHDNNNSMSEVVSSIDILTLVAQCLANPHDLIDLLHFAHVCKTWHQAAAFVQRRQGRAIIMPWLLSFERSVCRFGLRDFWSSKQNCSRELKIIPELKKFTIRGLPIFISKHGWLLLRKPVCYLINRLNYSHQTKVEFLFCNPVLNKIIELPCLYLAVGEKVDKSMINSTHPSLAGRNSDCVVAIISSRSGENYRVVTCNPRARNKEWTSHIISVEDVRLDPNTWRSTYMDGTLYCCFRYKDKTTKMGMFGIANIDSGVAPRVHFSLIQLEEQWCDFFELFEFNGELLLATRCLMSRIGWGWRVYQFDPLRNDSRKQWTSIESLGNRALAISTWPSQFSRDKVVVVHEAKEFADMIIDGNTTYTRQIDDDRGSIWRKDKYHEWNFMGPSVTYIEPIL